MKKKDEVLYRIVWFDGSYNTFYKRLPSWDPIISQIIENGDDFTPINIDRWVRNRSIISIEKIDE